jgi:hypothetical protein
MRSSATGAVKRYGGVKGGRTATNWNVMSSTAGLSAVSDCSNTPQGGITRVQVPSTRHADYLIMAALLAVFIIASRKG